MAGMLPGVGVAKRRSLPFRQEDHLGSGREYFRERMGLPAATSSLDETALMARRRLEQKLGYIYSSPRNGKIHQQQQEGGDGGGNKKMVSRMLLGRTWNLGFNRLLKPDRKVCAVCLEGFRGGGQCVMDLSCSHKYHSECLLPWIVDHPHCPCCRTPI
ncbi:hypothetical protein SAY87_018578 [Trapa incisa]|uniref:RING-type domain-containing protein n=1 Tax=Trapa incisa TaxID=236973 RepID=A0AAN7L3P1_9MYRT|nr:hypothetical protein SAY87_018578 [Trapa incisa]